MNKARRNELKKLKFTKRIKRYARNLDIYVNRNGEYIRNPKWIDIVKDNGQTCYRTTSTPCSCLMCSPNKYNRAKEKRKFMRDTDWA
jgi:hypothetical protein